MIITMMMMMMMMMILQANESSNTIVHFKMDPDESLPKIAAILVLSPIALISTAPVFFCDISISISIYILVFDVFTCRCHTGMTEQQKLSHTDLAVIKVPLLVPPN